MSNQKYRFRRAGIIACMLTSAAFLTTGSMAWADPDMDGHHGMHMGDHCRGEGMGHDMHGMQPHNAAAHILKMGSSLKLTPDQIKQLTKMRDDYIEKNATAEEQIKAANEDVTWTLYSDDVDLNKLNALFDKVSKMNSQLWHAYAQQMHDIKALLTPEQKKDLKSMWGDHHPHGLEEMMHGDMPMHDGMMPMHKDMW